MSKMRTLSEGLRAFLNGFSQIMLQESILTGLLFLTGIFCGSLFMGLATTVAVITGTLTAITLKYARVETIKGLYGFSAALTGVALALFFQPTMVVWITILMGAALASILQHLFIIRKIPGYTFPFIIVTWLCLFILHQLPQWAPPRMTANSQMIVQANFDTVFLGFGQVIFQDKWWVGLIFLAGILINSPVAAAFGVGGAVLSGLLANYLGEPLSAIYGGLLNYNAVLCAIAFAGWRRTTYLYALTAVILSTMIMVLMRYFHLSALTFPFVLASWLTLLIESSLSYFDKLRGRQ